MSIGRISGKGIHGKIGSNLIAGIYDLDIAEDGDNLDATTAEDLGGLRDDTGCSRITATIKGYFDLTNGTSAPVRRGTTVTNLNLYLTFDETGTGKKAYIGEGLVQRYQITGQVRDRVMFTTVIVSQGNDYDIS
jgi:hypothetical protein